GRSGAAAVDRLAAGNSRGHGVQPSQHLRRTGASQRIEVADADDGRREPAEDAACAHGEHQSPDHAGRDAGGFSKGGPHQHQGGGESSKGFENSRQDSGGHGPDSDPESKLQVAEDERDYQPGEMGQLAGRRSVYYAGRGEWNVRD